MIMILVQPTFSNEPATFKINKIPVYIFKLTCSLVI